MGGFIKGIQIWLCKASEHGLIVSLSVFFYPKINWYFWLIFVIFILHGINLFFNYFIINFLFLSRTPLYIYWNWHVFKFYTGFGFNISECNDILQAQYVYTAVT